MIITSHSVQQTHNLGLTLAKKVQGGQIYALSGDLGGGKTCFAQGFIKGMGVTQPVTSPTFILMQIFKLKSAKINTVCHVDLYRLEKINEILELGLVEYLNNPKSVVIIEWADKIKNVLTSYNNIIKLNFSFINHQTRKISITNLPYKLKVVK